MPKAKPTRVIVEMKDHFCDVVLPSERQALRTLKSWRAHKDFLIRAFVQKELSALDRKNSRVITPPAQRARLAANLRKRARKKYAMSVEIQQAFLEG